MEKDEKKTVSSSTNLKNVGTTFSSVPFPHPRENSQTHYWISRHEIKNMHLLARIAFSKTMNKKIDKGETLVYIVLEKSTAFLS